ncbi:hypothetical protein NITMOv2_4329 [Nitrospira moscoviensis]|uniref:Uncharacterized protein n=1 Tax=Nitrospira moscoviensis TaxID=42253 RepID=A0A0K2GID1_NITMO|nr:hypothetical protein NITMOv2_4329 [Nitrospira moscoviensis]
MPGPVTLTVNTAVFGAAVNVAVIVAVSSTTQEPVPLQPPPLQPAKVEPGAALAVNVAGVSWSKSRQLAPQGKPGGEEVTVPLPFRLTVTRNGRKTVIGMGCDEGNVTLALPENNKLLPLLKARTRTVRLSPKGALTVSGISCPEDRFDTGTEFVCVAMSGPDISISTLAT